MNINITMQQQLAVWITGVIEAAKQDTEETIFLFVPTMDKPFIIIAGWKNHNSKFDMSDLFCCSKSAPEKAMYLQIADNTDIASTNFDDFTTAEDSICIPLEWDDNPEVVAEFFTMEFERLMK